ncbi:MAG: hypothetical protein FJZ63_03805 [Chlamydiae bacterium]|nr:hypothetical protein [Chlamydiota bacterium]
MRKLIVSVVLVAVIVFSLRSFFVDRIPKLAAQFLSHGMHVPIYLKKIVFHSSFLEVKDFAMVNPKEANFEYALTVDTLHVSAPYMSYVFADPLVLDHIFLEDVRINLEISKDNTTACNWNIIAENVKANRTHWYSNERKTFIKQLILRNIVIGVKLYGKNVQVLSPIPIMEFHNIDVSEGLPIQEISKIIVDKLVSTVYASEAVKAFFSLPFQLLIKPFDSKNPKDSCQGYTPDPGFKVLAWF